MIRDIKKYFLIVFLLVFSGSVILNFFAVADASEKDLISIPAFYQQRQLALGGLPPGSGQENPPTKPPQQPAQPSTPPRDQTSQSQPGRCDPNSNSDKLCNPIPANNIRELVIQLLKYLIGIIGIVAVAVIVVSGFRMVISAGQENQIKQAKSALTWAIIGFAVSVLAYSIIAIVQNALTQSK